MSSWMEGRAIKRLARNCQSGFTLIEVMVAAFIFAVLATIAWLTFDQAFKASDRLNQEVEQLLTLQRAINTLSSDFAQYHPRPVREPVGNAWRPALLADSRSNYIVELTRSGYGNPLQAPRASSLRVAYRFEEGELVRAQWPVLDPVIATVPQETVLLGGIEQILFRFLGEADDSWSEQWPPLNATRSPPPRAVEIVLIHEYWGELRRIIEVRS
ncbi:MAG: type II secretion system minor pseudopilin GspJ [Pseudomonadota bacterium]